MIPVNIMNAVMTCIAYDENTIMSEKSWNLVSWSDTSVMRNAPVQ